MSNKKKILIAEDEVALAKAMQLKLIKSGYDVKIAVDGQEAMDMVKKNGYNLMLLDLIMPKKDGFVVLQEMQKNKISLPVIVVSNLGQEEDLKKAKNLGAKGYLIKANSTLEEIVKKINDYLN